MTLIIQVYSRKTFVCLVLIDHGQCAYCRNYYNSFFPIMSDEPETRDAWWKEVRQEIKSHSHSMCCNAVIGYTEDTSIWYEEDSLWVWS